MFHRALVDDETATVQAAKSQGRRRALPSPAEQERRKAWGAKWGKLVRDGYQRTLKERG
jgi:hypothetical protein